MPRDGNHALLESHVAAICFGCIQFAHFSQISEVCLGLSLLTAGCGLPMLQGWCTRVGLELCPGGNGLSQVPDCALGWDGFLPRRNSGIQAFPSASNTGVLKCPLRRWAWRTSSASSPLLTRFPLFVFCPHCPNLRD